MRWGITNKVDAWEKCCEQCLNFQPSPGKPTCNGEIASAGHHGNTRCGMCLVLIQTKSLDCGDFSVGLVWRQGRLW